MVFFTLRLLSLLSVLTNCLGWKHKVKGWARIIRYHYVSAGNALQLMRCWIHVGVKGQPLHLSTASVLGCFLVLVVRPSNRHGFGGWGQAPGEDSHGNTRYRRATFCQDLSAGFICLNPDGGPATSHFHRLNVLSCHELWCQRIKNLP